MNRTTVKRGIGAVILALIAAALLGYLLKDKAAQRKDVVEIAFPGGDGADTSSNTERLPELTTDNSSGNVVATADGDAKAMVSDASQSVIDGVSDAGDKVVASAAAASAAVTAAASSATDTAKSTIDFSVRPLAKDTEYLELDLVNNSNTAAASSTASPAATASSAAQSAATTEVAVVAPAVPASEGKIIASTKASAPQARLIEEKSAPKISSASTAKVITKSRPVSQPSEPVIASAEATIEPPAAPQAPAAAPAASGEAANGYAIQLLATSSQSRANDLKNVMAREGYPTYVTKTTQNGKQLYRVRIGQHQTRAAAAVAHNAMKRRYKKNKNVINSAIVAR